MNPFLNVPRMMATLCCAGMLFVAGCVDEYLAPGNGCETLIAAAPKTTLFVGETTRLSVRYGSGSGLALRCPVVDYKVVSFSTTNTGIVSVSDAYDVIALSPGTAAVSIKIGLLSSAPITFHVIAP